MQTTTTTTATRAAINAEFAVILNNPHTTTAEKFNRITTAVNEFRKRAHRLDTPEETAANVEEIKKAARVAMQELTTAAGEGATLNDFVPSEERETYAAFFKDYLTRLTLFALLNREQNPLFFHLAISELLNTSKVLTDLFQEYNDLMNRFENEFLK